MHTYPAGPDHDVAVLPGAPDAEARRAEARETFLGSTRALPICAREFERLADDIARQAAAADVGSAELKAEVRRAPGRCIVQLGPVALTVSWVRARAGTVSEGRLLVVEWQGTVGRGTERIPERGLAPLAGKPATLLREDVLMVDATSERDWRWRRESAPAVGYDSRELAALCVRSLVATLRAESGRA
jgi:hypothetical protein